MASSASASSLGSALALPPGTPNLAEHKGLETLYSPEVVRVIINWALGATKCYHPAGLLYLTASPPQWEALPGNTITPPQPAVPAIPAHGDQPAIPAVEAVPGEYLPRPSALPPPRPAANANATAWKIYELDSQRAREIGTINSTFKQNFEAILGPDVVRDIADPTFGTAYMEPYELFQAFCTKYGTPSSIEVNALEAKLALPLTGMLGPHLVTHAYTHAQLAAFGQPLSEIAKFRAFEKSICDYPEIIKAVAAFKTDFPVLSDQTFEALKLYLTKQLPNLPVTAAQHGYGSSIVQNLTAAKAGDAELTTQLLATIAALQGQLAQTAAAAHGPPVAHLAQGGSIPRVSRAKAYCFVHGHRGHTGATCRTMAADKTYTAAHKAATAPNEAFLNGSGGHPGRTALKKTN
jgi:hypothetical protein